MKTTNDYIRALEEGGVLCAETMTFPEYTAQFTAFQKRVCTMIAGADYHDNMHIEEAQYLLQAQARAMGKGADPAVQNAVLTMKKLAKESAILHAGRKGEAYVAKTLAYLQRPNTRIFRNVYVTDGVNETEIDMIVLTDAGILLLEVKNVKSDVTLTEDGRMLVDGEEYNAQMPFGAKMERKRRLLRRAAERALARRGLKLPLYLDSFLVFSAPRGQFVHIEDRYHKEKFCFRTGINRKIENYLGCAYYKEAQLRVLAEVLEEMEGNVKRFAPGIDYDEARRSLAAALAVLDAPEETPKAAPVRLSPAAQPVREVRRPVPEPRRAAGLGYVAASVCAGLLLSGAAAVLRTLRRAS